METLNTTGFLFTDTSIAVSLVSAGFGDGYDAARMIGSAEGLRTWTIKIDVLPDNDAQVPKIAGEARAEYLWQFFLRSKTAGNQPFRVWDPKTNKNILAAFVDHQLSYQIFCFQVYGAGLQLRQRRR